MKTKILLIIITCNLCLLFSLIVLADNSVELKDNSLAKDLYAIGYYYYTNQQYEQADIVLRYMLLYVLKVKDPCASEWHYAAQRLLMSDLMYTYYSGKTYWNKYQWIIKSMQDEDLFDIESVMRKYGNYISESEKKSFMNNNMGTKKMNININNEYSIDIRFLDRRMRSMFFKGDTYGKQISRQIMEVSDRSTGSVQAVEVPRFLSITNK